MVSSAATTVDQYLASLPADRRSDLARVRDVVNARIPDGYKEGMLYGMIGWYIPLDRYAETYNGQPLCLAGLAAQKQHSSLYLMTVYGDPAIEKAFRAGFAAAGKKLDMGKSCVRFTSADALALDVIGETLAKVTPEMHIAQYEQIRAATKTGAKAAARAKAAGRAKAKTARPTTSGSANASSKAEGKTARSTSAKASSKAKAKTARPSAPSQSKAAKPTSAKASSKSSSTAKTAKPRSAKPKASSKSSSTAKTAKPRAAKPKAKASSKSSSTAKTAKPRAAKPRPRRR